MHKVIHVRRGSPRSFTHGSKLGFNTRRSDELLIEKSFTEAPKSWFDPSLLRDFAGNSNVVRTLDFACSRGSSQAILSMILQLIHAPQNQSINFAYVSGNFYIKAVMVVQDAIKFVG